MSRHTRANRDQGSIAVLVISLADQPRNQNLIPDLRAMGFNPTLVTAVDARTWTPPFAGYPVDTTSFFSYYGRPLSGGEVGCSLSHMRCYQIAVELGLEWTIILEEDAVINQTFTHILPALDVLATESPRVLTFRTTPVPAMRKKSLINVASDDGSSVTLGRLFAAPYLTVGYAINAAAATQAASYPCVTWTADWPPWAHAFDFWGIYPWPVSIHDESQSVIAAGRTEALIEMKTRRLSGFIFMRLFDSLDIGKIGFWRVNLGGFRQYLRHIAFPRLRMHAGKMRQTCLSDAPESPLVR